MSLPNDIEQNPGMDALLRSVLRAADGVEAGDCPDAEVIGLYAERALAGAELRAVEAHVHTCPRCQATVAAFVRALPGAATEAAGEASAGGGFAAWFAGWRWLVPAASLTAVALVAVWVGRGPADQVAESAREPAAMAETAAAVQLAQPGSDRQAEAFVPPVARSREVDGAAMADRLAKSAAAAAARREVAGVPADRAAAANTTPPGRTPAAGAPPEATAKAAPPAPPVQETLTVTQAPAAPAARAIAAPSPAAGGSTAAATTAGASAAVRAEASAERRARPGEVLGASDATIVRVPPTVSFRLREGAIERSLDQGATWQRAVLPAGVTVLAITSPVPNVCWAVAADAVLRATDGATFTREPVPTTDRLTALTATDAMRAVVTTASGARFATTNGGRTWTAAP